MPAACRAAYRRHRPTPHAFGPRECSARRLSYRPGVALPRGSIDDRLVLVGVVAEVAIPLALILVPPLRAIFGLAPLGVTEWSPPVCFRAIVCWVAGRRGIG